MFGQLAALEPIVVNGFTAVEPIEQVRAQARLRPGGRFISVGLCVQACAGRGAFFVATLTVFAFPQESENCRSADARLSARAAAGQKTGERESPQQHGPGLGFRDSGGDRQFTRGVQV